MKKFVLSIAMVATLLCGGLFTSTAQAHGPHCGPPRYSYGYGAYTGYGPYNNYRAPFGAYGPGCHHQRLVTQEALQDVGLVLILGGHPAERLGLILLGPLEQAGQVLRVDVACVEPAEATTPNHAGYLPRIHTPPG